MQMSFTNSAPADNLIRNFSDLPIWGESSFEKFTNLVFVTKKNIYFVLAKVISNTYCHHKGGLVFAATFCVDNTYSLTS